MNLPLDLAEAVRQCAAVSELNKRYGPAAATASATSATHVEIIAALEQFQEGVRYLNTRRSKGAILNLDAEAQVQDAVYLMLRPWVHDLVPENPTDKVAAARFAIKDFVSRSAQAVVEVKYIRDKDHGKNITKELHDDIETYRSHASCRYLIFFIYDPNSLIPD